MRVRLDFLGAIFFFWATISSALEETSYRVITKSNL